MSEKFGWRLLPGEKVVWSGRPRGGVSFVPRDLLLIPFSLMWGGFAIFWEATVLTMKAPLLFRLWGVPFVVVGLYLIAGRFFVDAWLRRKTHYAVTDQRVLIDRRGLLGRTTALSLDRLPEMQLQLRRDGSGTISFGQAATLRARGFSSWSPALDPTPQFIALDDAQGVFDDIQRRQNSRR